MKMGWQEIRLGELFSIKHGYAFKGQFFSSLGKYIVLTPGNFGANGGITLKGDKEKYYSAEFPKEFLLDSGDLLIVMTDLTQNAPLLGSPAFIKEKNRYLHNQRLGKIVDIDETRLDKNFLYYLFNTKKVRDHIKASATGATVKHTAPERIYSVKVFLPPLSEQRKIAGILTNYDDLIENNTRRIKILEETAQAIYKEWFVHFRFPGHENAKFVDSPLGKIPEGWHVNKAGNVFDTFGGGTPSTSNLDYWEGGDVIWFSPTDLTRANNMFITDSAKKITRLGLQQCAARLFPPYSVMMTSRATIGAIAINTKSACTNQGFITCIPNDDLSTYQIYFWLKEAKEQILSLATGATFKEINRTTFRNLSILVPQRKISKTFSDMTAPFGARIQNLQEQNNNLGKTRDLLLPKLISGDIKLSNSFISYN